MHDLLRSKFSKAHAELIGNNVGRLLDNDLKGTEEFYHSCFICLRVEVDITEPLPRAFPIRRKFSFPF